MCRRLPLVLLVAAFAAPLVSAGDVDLGVIHRIKREAFDRSQVMETAFRLTDVNGPRLTNSPGFDTAADWVVETLRSWGLEAEREAYGEFGPGWTLDHLEAHLLAPYYDPMVAEPLAWCGSTDGEVRGEPLVAPLYESWERSDTRDPAKLRAMIDAYRERWTGKLAGRIVLLSPSREFQVPTEPAARRLDAKALAEVADAPDPEAVPDYELPVYEVPRDPEERSRFMNHAPQALQSDYWSRRRELWGELNTFLAGEGVAAVFTQDRRGDGGVIFAEATGSPYGADVPVPPAMLVLRPEDYSRLLRLAKAGVATEVMVDVRTTRHGADLTADNVIAELPGGRKADEVVMLGGHLDSWHTATGATDNAGACAVAMEAMRILASLDEPLDRTVRLALWSGEEQGLLGSAAYVRNHFGDPVTMELKPEHARISGYFNLDNGAGRIRGVYLQGNDAMRPEFKAWFAPFADLDVQTISIRDTRSTDHRSFDAVGIPAFQFLQDRLDYWARTHHADLDTYERLVPADLMQSAAVLAAVVYQAATREEMLPRKPLPDPLVK